MLLPVPVPVLAPVAVLVMQGGDADQQFNMGNANKFGKKDIAAAAEWCVCARSRCRPWRRRRERT